MTNLKILNVLKNYIPQNALLYCVELWMLHPFKFVVKKKRATKLGDYSYSAQTKLHTITVNGDANPYSFLITYLHEYAHLITTVRYGFYVKPHGKEWKNCFKEVLYPVLRKDVFPEKLMFPLLEYIANPAASSCSDYDLYKALASFDENPKQLLSELQIGDVFYFNKKFFTKKSVKRTRALCTEVDTELDYLVPLLAEVELVQTSIWDI